GYILPDGEFVGKNILIELIKINNGNDYRIAHQLGEHHLLVEGTSRMNVKIAAQVFSNSVAKAISFAGENGYFSTYKNAVNIKILNLLNKVISK
ncbi:general transcription factor II-I repeat domain-containing protein 2-like, partial [Aphis craccivora]